MPVQACYNQWWSSNIGGSYAKWYQETLYCRNIKINFKIASLKPVLGLEASGTEDLVVNLNWSIAESINLYSFLILYSLNESNVFLEYFERSNVDYIDSNQFVTTSNLSECYTKCLSNSSCRAVKWNKIDSSCALKTNTNGKVTCSEDSDCLTIPEYRSEARIKNHLVNIKYCYIVQVTFNGFLGMKSNQACFKCKADFFRFFYTS